MHISRESVIKISLDALSFKWPVHNASDQMKRQYYLDSRHDLIHLDNMTCDCNQQKHENSLQHATPSAIITELHIQ